MGKETSGELREFVLPDDLHARLVRCGYRQVDIDNIPPLEEYRLYTAERDGVYTFVAVDAQPRPQQLLVTGVYFHRHSDVDETVNSQLEQTALSAVITDVQSMAWRRLHPSRWQQLFVRHRFAITVAVAVAIVSGIFVYLDGVSARINVFGFVRSLSARLGDSEAEYLGLLMVCARIVFVLVTTSVGYWIASLFGAWRHPIMSVPMSARSLNYYYGHLARRVIEDLEKELKKPPAPAVAHAVVAAPSGAEPAPWHGYDNFVSYEEFQKRFRLETKRAARFVRPLSCLIMTVEPVSGGAKAVSEDIEARIRRECSRLIWHEIREIDSFARYGDNGFIFLLPSTHAEGAQTLEKRLRTQVGSCDLGGYSIVDTATIRTGVSSIMADQCTEWEELVRGAESSLEAGCPTSPRPSQTDSGQTT